MNCVCGLERRNNKIPNLEKEKKIYNTTMLSADTQYCHHLNSKGEHIVLNNLPLEEANKCPGIMYFKVDWNGKYFKCDKKRAGNNHGHDPCTKERCPYLRDGKICPYNLSK